MKNVSRIALAIAVTVSVAACSANDAKKAFQTVLQLTYDSAKEADKQRHLDPYER